jgi:hypothetical protein
MKSCGYRQARFFLLLEKLPTDTSEAADRLLQWACDVAEAVVDIVNTDSSGFVTDSESCRPLLDNEFHENRVGNTTFNASAG